jgi:glucosamine--fructose-6-phosphate aminotransferase (isomerizing)
MCGIFGFVAEPGSLFQREQFQPLLNQLFRLSESRGKDASGVALVTDGQLQVLKRPQRARSLIRTREYAAMIRAAHGPGDEPLLVMGHARMVTNGRKEYHVNNQPVIKQGRVCLHNGIVVNDGALWAQFAGLRREYEVDTEIILSLIEHFCQQGQTLIQAVVSTFRHIEGANSIALLDSGINGLVLATSNGSLYFARGQAGRELVFASEKYIIERTVQHPAVAGLFAGSGIQQVGPGQGYAFQTGDLSGLLPAGAQPLRVHDHVDGVAHILPDWNGAVIDRSRYPANDAYMQRVNEAVSRLRRCERCLLPESFPFIIFDGDGVCNYCQQYRPFPFKGEDALRELVAPYRRQDGRPDCIISGRCWG